jgi:hypothetical protein
LSEVWLLNFLRSSCGDTALHLGGKHLWHRCRRLWGLCNGIWFLGCLDWELLPRLPPELDRYV